MMAPRYWNGEAWGMPRIMAASPPMCKYASSSAVAMKRLSGRSKSACSKKARTSRLGPFSLPAFSGASVCARENRMRGLLTTWESVGAGVCI